jgi:hypothetical protein
VQRVMGRPTPPAPDDPSRSSIAARFGLVRCVELGGKKLDLAQRIIDLLREHGGHELAAYLSMPSYWLQPSKCTRIQSSCTNGAS